MGRPQDVATLNSRKAGTVAALCAQEGRHSAFREVPAGHRTWRLPPRKVGRRCRTGRRQTHVREPPPLTAVLQSPRGRGAVAEARIVVVGSDAELSDVVEGPPVTTSVPRGDGHGPVDQGLVSRRRRDFSASLEVDGPSSISRHVTQSPRRERTTAGLVPICSAIGRKSAAEATLRPS